MKFRILTNGLEYIVQRKGFIFWRAPLCEGCSSLRMSGFRTYEDAEREILRRFGTESEIINPSRYVIAIIRRS